MTHDQKPITTLRIGTRKSPLALAQANEVRNRLLTVWPEISPEHITLVGMTTSGDRFVDRSLSDIGGKGLFTKELEDGLLSGTLDIAVHSMKDMPTSLPPGLVIGCMLEREDPRDMVVVAKDGLRSLRDIVPGSTFGTSSLRRSAQLLMQRPDIRIVPMRGNVETRLRKIEQGEATATMLAVAGLKRLGILDRVHGYIPPIEEFLPAVAQGAIGIECREDNTAVQALLKPLSHTLTEIAVRCERAFLKALDGSCRTPIAGYATVTSKGLSLLGLVMAPDGKKHYALELNGKSSEPEILGYMAGERLLAQGAGDCC